VVIAKNTDRIPCHPELRFRSEGEEKGYVENFNAQAPSTKIPRLGVF
jgi:hypothetical protein